MIVQLANCWKSGLGYGYSLSDYELLTLEHTWQAFTDKFPKANHYTWQQYAGVLETHLAQAQEFAEQVFSVDKAVP